MGQILESSEVHGARVLLACFNKELHSSMVKGNLRLFAKDAESMFKINVLPKLAFNMFLGRL